MNLDNLVKTIRMNKDCEFLMWTHRWELIDRDGNAICRSEDMTHPYVGGYDALLALASIAGVRIQTK